MRVSLDVSAGAWLPPLTRDVELTPGEWDPHLIDFSLDDDEVVLRFRTGPTAPTVSVRITSYQAFWLHQVLGQVLADPDQDPDSVDECGVADPDQNPDSVDECVVVEVA